MTSINAFAKSLSLKRGENLYQIKKGNNGISKHLADLIVEKYPEVNKLWLLTGEGTMLQSGAIQNSVTTLGGIPYYSGDLEAIIADRALMIPTEYINVPEISCCDFAVKHIGNALLPTIGSGAILTLMQVDPKIILFGQLYLVSTYTPSYPIVRIVRKSVDESKIKLVAFNSDYEEIEIEKSDIREMFIVKGFSMSLI